MTAPHNTEAPKIENSGTPAPAAAPAAPTTLEALQKQQQQFINKLNGLKSSLAEADAKVTAQRAESDAANEKVAAEGKAQVDRVRKQVREASDQVRATERVKVDEVTGERNEVAGSYREVLDAAVARNVFTKANLELLGYQAPRR